MNLVEFTRLKTTWHWIFFLSEIHFDVCLGLRNQWKWCILRNAIYRNANIFCTNSLTYVENKRTWRRNSTIYSMTSIIIKFWCKSYLNSYFWLKVCFINLSKFIFSKHSSPKPAEKTKTPAPPTEQSSMSAGGEVAPSSVDMSERKSRMVTQQSQPGSRPTSPERMVPLYDKDLIRMLAEVAFIQGEVITLWEHFL